MLCQTSAFKASNFRLASALLSARGAEFAPGQPALADLVLSKELGLDSLQRSLSALAYCLNSLFSPSLNHSLFPFALFPAAFSPGSTSLQPAQGMVSPDRDDSIGLHLSMPSMTFMLPGWCSQKAASPCRGGGVVQRLWLHSPNSELFAAKWQARQPLREHYCTKPQAQLSSTRIASYFMACERGNGLKGTLHYWHQTSMSPFQEAEVKIHLREDFRIKMSWNTNAKEKRLMRSTVQIVANSSHCLWRQNYVKKIFAQI